MRASFDWPLETLKTYRGTNPRPTDFDEYWTNALAEMHGLDGYVVIEAADFQTPIARCEHLWFTGVGGARIHAKLLRPRQQTTPGPAVLLFHGYTMDSGNWFEKLGWVAAGFTVAALDCRGQAGLSEDNGQVRGWTHNGQIVRGMENDDPHKLYYRAVYLDTAQLAAIIANLPEVDETRMGAMGYSQGGGLTLACAALESRLSRIVPVYPFLTDYQRAYEVDAEPSAYEEITQWFKRRDPLHKREAAIFERLGYIDVQHFAERISAETHLILGLQDTYCPPSTQFAAYNKIAAPKQMTIYPDFGHDKLPRANDIAFQFLSQL